MSDTRGKVEAYFSSTFWGLNVFHDTFNGGGVLVAILANGAKRDHNALKGSWATPQTILYGHNFMDGSESIQDTYHGTAIASVVAGTHRLFPAKEDRNRYHLFEGERLPLGVAPKASLVICKVAELGPSEDAIVKALRWIHAHNTVVMRLKGYEDIKPEHITAWDVCKSEHTRQRMKICIVLMPFRLFQDNEDIRECIAQLNQQQVLCVAGVGNDGCQRDPGYPALYENVLSVGSVNWLGKISDFSTRHPTRVDVYALGENVLVANTQESLGSTSSPGSQFERQSGTGYASAAVAGLVAILVQCAREQGGEELAQHITHLDTLKKLMKKHLLYEIPDSSPKAYLLRPQNIENFFQKQINNLIQVIQELNAPRCIPETQRKGIESTALTATSPSTPPHSASASDVPALDKLCSDYHLSSSDLDKTIDDENILKIYSQMSHWKLVAAHLKLSNPDIDDIKTRAKDNEKLMRLYTLQDWREKKIIEGAATVRVLLNALLESDCSHTAIQLCKLLSRVQ